MPITVKVRSVDHRLDSSRHPLPFQILPFTLIRPLSTRCEQLHGSFIRKTTLFSFYAFFQMVFV